MDNEKKKINKAYNTELNIFDSFKEAAEFEASYNAGISGIEHLTNSTQLIKRIYLNELLGKNDLKIHLK